MVRLTRAEQQERNRAAVLAAARAEFAERGYADAKVDRIAERAELTRGAVYSNFPSKRALYLAVLLDSLEPPASVGLSPAAAAVGSAAVGSAAGSAATSSAAGSSAAIGLFPEPAAVGSAATNLSYSSADALGAFARAWLERLPLTGDSSAGGHLRLRSLAGVFDDEPGRVAVAQVAKLEALLLGRALETPGARRVRLAELVLTLLNGAGHLAEKAPGFGDPFDVIRACQHLAGLDLGDTWDPPHLPFVRPAESVREEWAPPDELPDLLTGHPVQFGDGVLVVLGTSRLGAAEEVVRATAWTATHAAADEAVRAAGGTASHAAANEAVHAAAGSAIQAAANETMRPGAGTASHAAAGEAVRAAAKSGIHAAADGAVRAAAGTARAAGEVVRAGNLTVVVVTSDPAELGRLVRLRVGDLVGCLRAVFGAAFSPGLRLVLDEKGSVAAAVGVREADDTEAAVRIDAGEIVARAVGRGAAHAVGSTRINP